jgi:hypothetical protein
MGCRTLAFPYVRRVKDALDDRMTLWNADPVAKHYYAVDVVLPPVWLPRLVSLFSNGFSASRRGAHHRRHARQQRVRMIQNTFSTLNALHTCGVCVSWYGRERRACAQTMQCFSNASAAYAGSSISAGH